MNYFHFFKNIAVFPSVSVGFRSSVRNFNSMENFILFHDQSAFTLIFVGTMVLHVFLGISIGIISELQFTEPPPIRARVGVRYAKQPLKPTPIKRPKLLVEKPVLQELKTDLSPKLSKLVPSKPLLKKPVLENNLKKTTFQKPALKKNEVQRLKLSEPKISKKLPTIKQNSTLKLPAFKTPKKPLLIQPDYPVRTNEITNFPKFSKDPVPLSPLTSSKSLLKPSGIELPEFTQEEFTQKKLKSPDFSKTFDLPTQKLPEIIQPALEANSTISPVESENKLFDKPEIKLEKLFPEKITQKKPLQDLGIPDQTALKKSKDLPDTNYLQRKIIAQLAGEEYNLHIRTMIIPKLGSYPSELFVRIRLKINASGDIIEYEVINKSGLSSFDQAAELAVRNAVLAPLPPALAANPPYIVLIRIVPQN